MTESGERIKHIIEANIRRAKIQPAVFPLALRGASQGEIRKLLNLRYGAVKNAVDKMRRKGEGEDLLRLPRPTPQSSQEGRRRTGLVNNGYTQAQLYSLEFAKSLIGEGLVGPDLTNWNTLHNLYRGQHKRLPPDFTDQLRLEIFVAARVAILESNNTELLRRYVDLGRNVNEWWFENSLPEDEDSIVASIEYAKQGYQVDRKGFFVRNTPDGIFRELVFDEEAYDNPHRARKREMSRLHTSKA